MWRIRVGVVVGVLVLGIGGVVAPAEAGGRLERDVAALRDTGVTGVLVRVGDREVRSGAVPADPYIRIGSTTKTFTAVVALQLVAEGRLSLDDTVERWLPGVVRGNGNDGRAITVRQLLQQTTGLYDYTSDLIWNYVTPESYRRERWRTYRPAELVAIAMSHPPEEVTWSYSNTNYVLAGLLIEAVTGRPWDREVRDRIVAPLGLRRTITPGTWPFLPRPHATNRHQFEPGGTLVDTTVAVRGLDSGADGSIISTAGDLGRFMSALLGGRLLPPAQQAQMRTLVAMPEGSGYPAGTGYGLGIFRVPLSCGGGYWRHGGTGFGYQVEPAVTDDGRVLTLALFSNTFDQALAERRQPMVRDLIDRALC